MMKRVEMNEEVMMQVNGGVTVFNPLYDSRNIKYLDEKNEEAYRKEHNYREETVGSYNCVIMSF